MKTKTVPPLQLAIYFAIIYFFLFPSILFAQTTYQVNGRTILKQNNQYFDITSSDTVLVDTQHLTVEFHPTKEVIGNSLINNNYNTKLFYTSIDKQFFYTLDTTKDYLSTITNVISDENISKVYISYSFKGSLANNQGSAVTNNLNNSVPDDPYFDQDSYNKYLANMQMPEAWSLETGKSSIRIGFIGLGCDWNCADLPPDNLIGHNFIDGSNNTYPTLPFQPSALFNSQQGTRETSVISARTNNTLYMSGIAGGWNGNGGITPVYYVVGAISGLEPIYFTSLIAAAIDKSIDDGVKVINFTLNPPPSISQNISAAIQNAYQHGVVVVTNVGKCHPWDDHSVMFPATEEHVIAVGGSELTFNQLSIGDRFYFDEVPWGGTDLTTCWGDGLEVLANAKSVATLSYGDWYPNGIGTLIYDDLGTEYATSIVSGVAGLVLSANDCLTPDEVEEILIKSCEKLGPYIYNANGWCPQMGYGRVNAKRAVELALGRDTYTVQGNETWTGVNLFRGDIIVPPLSKLTLNGVTLKMGPQAGIIVQPGGILEINRSLLTALCTDTWKGITVQGIPSLPQYPYTNQGQAFIYNSTIEYARVALNSPNGGRLMSTNCQYTNNTLSVFCNAYDSRNLSNFNTCTFKNDLLHREPESVRYMVRLLQNTGATFTQCNFLNELTPESPSGYGIYSNSSDFTVNGGCSNPQISPCPDALSTPSVFNNFSYGIYAMLSPGGIKVEHGLFTNNNCGMYVSNSQNVKIWKSSFQIPSDQEPDPRGAYINSCSGFHIEGNTFNCSAATHADEVGLYLRNTGATQNYVYNNTFTNLFRGSVADGANRHATLATGLCYKCNDFSNNAYDIDVIRPANTILSATDGINRYQGLTSAGNNSANKDTLAASNTFSISPYQYNIHNINNPSNYYYQQYKTPYYSKIVPDPVLGINLFQNNSTTYNKPLVCKSWINSGGSIGQDLAAKSLANSNAGDADLLVQNTVDGGNTTNLTFDILGSTPQEALTLRDQLLQQSPYLSDTVMKTAIEQENVLPNAMVRDILTENPQAAKSEEIMSKLDDRWEPMPDYMKEEIETGKTIVGEREQLEAKRDGWLQQESFLTNRIVSTYLSDTVNPNAINELKAFLLNENTVPSGFALADICLQRGDFTGAAQAINTMQTNFTLSPVESQQAADYLALNTILASLQTDTIAISEVDSAHAIPLFALYQSGDNNATAMARDILIASGLLVYQEPINIGDNEKSAIAQLPAAKLTTTKQSSEQLNIFPNPATTYAIVEYSLPAKASHASISIYNTHGVVVWQQDVKRAKDQVIIDLNSIPSGSYRVALQSGNQTLTSTSLSVSK